jgi:hypothetical protein
VSRLDKDAIGVVFAGVGMAACLAIYAAQHALLVYGPVIRAWVHHAAGVPL